MNKIEYLKTNKKIRYLLAFVIPLFLNVFVFSVLGFYPFGEKMYMRMDAYHQYVRFFDFFKQIVYSGDFSQFLYTFSNGFGYGGALYFAYYLTSPFNFLVLIFPFFNMEIIFMLIMILKMSSLGLAFYYFLDKFEFKLGKWSYMFSTSYVFISFVTLYSMNIMWLDSLMLCPIILVHLKEMFDTKKIFKFTLLMFMLYFSNFYMAYIICVFMVILLLLNFFMYKYSKKDVFNKIKLFVTSIGISVLLFGFLMVPVLCELKESYGDNGNYLLLDNFPVQRVLSKFFAFKFDSLLTMNYYQEMSPYIYFGLLPFLLCLVYIVFVKEDGSKKVLIGAFLIIIMSFIIRFLNFAWHGFDTPTGFDYRYSFLISFLGLIMACKGFRYVEKQGLSIKQIMILIALVLLVILISFKEFGAVVLMVNLVFIALYIGLIAFSKDKNRWKEKALIVFAFELILNFIILNLMVNAQLGIENKDVYFREKSKDVIEKTFADNSIDMNYRIVIEKDVLPSVNTPTEMGYKGVSTFNSAIDLSFVQQMEKIGLFKIGEFAYFFDSNYITDSLFSVKYIISNRELILYKKIDELEVRGEKAYLYENPYVLPIGFISSNALKPIKDREVERNIFSIASSIAGKDYDYDKLYKTHVPVKVMIDNKEIKPDKNGDYILDRDDVNRRSCLKIEYKKGLDLGVRIGKNNVLAGLLVEKSKDKYRNTDVYIHKIHKDNSILEFDVYKNELYLAKLECINLGNLLGFEWNIEYLKDLLEDMKSISNDVMKVDSKNGRLLVDINAGARNERMFITSIPYSSSWKATVNGEEVDVLKSELATISIKVDNESSEIELKYIPKGLKLGCLMTLSGIVFLLVRIKKFEQN